MYIRTTPFIPVLCSLPTIHGSLLKVKNTWNIIITYYVCVIARVVDVDVDTDCKVEHVKMKWQNFKVSSHSIR